jgi:acetyltransferase
VSIRNLDAVFSPRSVAVIGASPRPGTAGATVTRNVVRGGFKGTVGLVNPWHSKIDGKPCVARISLLSEPPELGVIATPAETVPALVAELAQAGARAAVILTAGMSSERKAQALEAARPTCLRLAGRTASASFRSRQGSMPASSTRRRCGAISPSCRSRAPS